MAITLTLAKLIVPIEGDSTGLEKGIGSAQKLVQGFGTNMQRIGRTAFKAFAIGATAVGTGAAAAGAALGKLALDAAPIQNISNAFAGVAKSVGKGAQDILGALKKASAGMVDNEALMLSFNKAASLVSTDFAQKLPDAMQYLSKVSASTGQSMDFLLDSLVTGVGRLSPMILDNLGIQVSLAEATKKASEMFGVEASALTKTQQQAGLTQVVIEKLKATTSAMPDITKSAAAMWARLQATFKNAKDQIGMALLPAFSKLMGVIAPIIDKALPVLMDFFEDRIVPAIDTVADVIANLIWQFQQTGDVIEAISMALVTMDLEGVISKDIVQLWWRLQEAVASFGDKLDQVLDVIRPYVTMAAEFVAENVKLQDVLVAVGAVLLSAVIPALVSLVATALPIVAIVGALIAIVAALRKAWETNFLGIRDAIGKLGKVFKDLKNYVLAVVEDGDLLNDWLTHLPEPLQVAISTMVDLWENTFLPTVETVRGFIEEELLPVFEAIQEVVAPAVDALLEFGSQILSAFSEGGLSGAIEEFKALWPGITETIAGAFSGILEIVGPILEEIGVQLLGAASTWGMQIQEGLGNAIGVDLPALFEQAVGTITGFGGQAQDAFGTFLEVGGTIIGVVTDIADVIAGVLGPTVGDAFSSLKESFSGLQPLGEALRGLFETMVPVFEAIGAVVGVVVVAALGLVVAAVSGLVDAFATAVPYIIGALTGLVNIVSGIVGVIVAAFSLVVGIVTGDTEKVAQAWESLKERAAQIWQGIKDLVVNAAQGLVDTVTSLVSGFVDGVIGYFSDLFNRLVGNSIVTDLVTTIIELFTGLPSKIIGALGSIAIGPLVDAFKNALPDTVAAFTTATTQILDKWRQHTAQILASATAFWTELLDQYNTQTQKWLSVLIAVHEDMLDAWDDHLATVLENLADFWDTVATIFSDGGDNALGIVESFLGSLTSEWDSAMSTLISSIQDMASTVISAMQYLSSSIGSITSQIVGWFGQQSSAAQSLTDTYAALERQIRDLEAAYRGLLGSSQRASAAIPGIPEPPSLVDALGPSIWDRGQGDSAPRRVVNQNLIVNAPIDVADVRQDLDTLAALAL